VARIRTIKPMFWVNDDMVALPFEYRLLFIGLWNFADDEGFLEYKPAQIKLQVFPGDPVDIVAGIKALINRGKGPVESLDLTIDGKAVKVLRIRGWKDHQVISRPTKSRYADAYANYQAGYPTHGVLHEHSRSTPSGREGKGRERKGKEEGQVGGGGHLGSDATQPPPPISGYEPWRCDDHQGVDVACFKCKQAKADHKASEAQQVAETKAHKANAVNQERLDREAEAAATEPASPEFVQAAIAKVRAATKEGKS